LSVQARLPTQGYKKKKKIFSSHGMYAWYVSYGVGATVSSEYLQEKMSINTEVSAVPQ
jgi:hypothetical protein